MPNTLNPVNSGCFDVDDIPYQRGEILTQFDAVNQKLRLFPRHDIGTHIINFTHYSQLVNGVTGLVFASFAELLQFCKDYVFATGSGAGGGTGTPRMFTFLIKIAPVAANEKPEGQYITDASLSGLNPDSLVMHIADGAGLSTYVGTGTIDYNSGLGRIGLVGGDAGTFQDGQTVTIFATLA